MHQRGLMRKGDDLALPSNHLSVGEGLGGAFTSRVLLSITPHPWLTRLPKFL